MQTITEIYNFYKFLYSQDIFKNQLEITANVIPIWEDEFNESINAYQQGVIQSVFISRGIAINTSKNKIFHNRYFPLLYSGFGDPEFIGYFDGNFINFDEEFAITDYGDINFVKKYSSVEEIWEKVIKPKILEFKI
jgi:hypothetical protein